MWWWPVRCPTHRAPTVWTRRGCNRWSAWTFPKATQRQTLTALGFRLEGNMAHVPSWRPDVDGEADLVEEVARVASLTKLEGRPLPRLNTGMPETGPVTGAAARTGRAAHLCGAGIQ